MNLISFNFLIFFVCVSIAYYLIQRFWFKKNINQIFLLLASLVFYSFSNIKFLPFLIFLFLVTYGFSFIVQKNNFLFVLSILIEILPLLFFKYVNFIISPFTTHKLNIFLPLGISFITFQCLSYLIDIKKGKIILEKNPITVFLFISFFPTISSGPIQRAENLIPQLKERHLFDYDNATSGMKLFAWGFFKKVLIADSLATYVNLIYKSPADYYGCAVLLATVFYSFQIYCDFSGYSDMAIGISKFLGFDMGKNFDHPYLSKSCSEFWKRWHISLSSWLKDYIYIPLGGSRVALPRIYLNLMITFLVSGIWHGAAWTFVIWGVIHGIYQCIGRALKSFNEKIPGWIRICFTFCLITFAWIFFRAESVKDCFTIIKKISLIPNELINQIPDFLKSYGIKNTVKHFFSINMSQCKTILVLIAFIAIEITTFKKDGLLIIGSKKLSIRWILYIFFVIFIYVNLPMQINNDFVYFNF